jgi:hypothetical protein
MQTELLASLLCARSKFLDAAYACESAMQAIRNALAVQATPGAHCTCGAAKPVAPPAALVNPVAVQAQPEPSDAPQASGADLFSAQTAPHGDPA